MDDSTNPAARSLPEEPAGATILDVARRAGVSPGTVSNVLNGKVPVSARRRDLVRKAIEELGYLPNTMAQGLRRKHTRTLAVCIPHTASGYLAALANAFEDCASARGFSVVQAFSRHDPDMEYRRVHALLGSRPAGLIIVPSANPAAALDLIHRSRVPAVVVDRLWQDDRFDYVTMDNERAMTGLAESLIGQGHRRILYVVSHPRLITTRHRIAALQAAAARHPGVTAQTLKHADQQPAFVADVAAIMGGKERPSVIIGSNSVVTMALIKAFKALGIAVPEQVSLVSFEEPDWADIVSPPLAVMRQPATDIGAVATDLLLQRVAGSTAPTGHHQLYAEYRPGPSVRPV